MKRGIIIILIVGVLATGTADTAAEEDGVKVLDRSWFKRMDTDQDRRVSRDEYMRYAAAYLQEKGRPVNERCLSEIFNSYDRNRDGYISDNDPISRDPVEVFTGRIRGSWSCGKNAHGIESITFMKDGQADIMKCGVSLREKSGGWLTYRIVHPNRLPVCLEIVLADGTASERVLKCIICFLDDNRLQVCAVVGKSTTPFPEDFEQEMEAQTFVLTRIPEPKPPPKHQNAIIGPLFGSPTPSQGG